MFFRANMLWNYSGDLEASNWSPIPLVSDNKESVPVAKTAVKRLLSAMKIADLIIFLALLDSHAYLELVDQSVN